MAKPCGCSSPCRCFSRVVPCPPYAPPSARYPLPWPPPVSDGGGYLTPGFSFGFDVATPPFPSGPDGHRSRIAATPASSSVPPDPKDTLPGFCRAPDPCAPQRRDTEAYRRLVFRGEITPEGHPAQAGVALDAAERAAAQQALNDATIHTPAYVQIHPGSWDFAHGAFSQGYG